MTGTAGNTFRTRWAAPSSMRRAAHDGQMWALQEKATSPGSGEDTAGEISLELRSDEPRQPGARVAVLCGLGQEGLQMVADGGVQQRALGLAPPGRARPRRRKS